MPQYITIIYDLKSTNCLNTIITTLQYTLTCLFLHNAINIRIIQLFMDEIIRKQCCINAFLYTSGYKHPFVQRFANWLNSFTEKSNDGWYIVAMNMSTKLKVVVFVRTLSLTLLNKQIGTLHELGLKLNELKASKLKKKKNESKVL